MTKLQQSKIERGTHVIVPKWEIFIRYGVFLTLFTLIYQYGNKDATDDARMFDTPMQKATVVNHVEQPSPIHMNLEKSQEMFVTRKEYEQTLSSFNLLTNTLNDTLEKLNKKLENE